MPLNKETKILSFIIKLGGRLEETKRQKQDEDMMM